MTDDEEESTISTLPSADPMKWLMSRLSYMSRQTRSSSGSAGTNNVCQLTVFKFFAAVTVTYPRMVLSQYLIQLINPLHRVVSAISSAQNDTPLSPVAQFATEVLTLLEETAARTPMDNTTLDQDRNEADSFSQAYLQVYSHVQQKVTAFRASRKTSRKIDAVQNPERAAKRKCRKNEAHYASKKKQHLAAAVGRGRVPRKHVVTLKAGASHD